MCKLNQDLADALCVVIACGFMDKMGGMRREEKSSGNNYTDFIYEGGDEKIRYERLSGELQDLGIHVEFKAPPSKAETPFIMAKTNRLTKEVLMGLQKDMQEWSVPLETEINAMEGGGLRGAYLGGYNDISKTEVLGVSDLYQYPPRFRKGDAVEYAHEIEAAYNGARAVTNAVVKHLSGPAKYVRSVREELSPVNEDHQTGNLFASVHGMTRAITTYPPLADNALAHFELALGSATSKVASCIPCSLLMAAVGRPATATHLGRGDNWNFPVSLGTNGAYIKAIWAKYVIECYVKGKEKLENLHERPLLYSWFEQDSGLNSEQIPDMFLEALTYESSFMTKIERVLAYL